MSLNLYDITVPILQRALEQLLHILQDGEKWAAENNVDKQTLIDGKIASDMKPLTFQIQTVCNTSKNTLNRIGGQGDLPAVEDNEKTFEDYYARINATLELLKAAKREKFIGAEEKVEMTLGNGMELKFTGITFVQRFALPNFFFHHMTAYLILRSIGVPLGKAVFLGGQTIQDA